MTTESILEEILEERVYQNSKWGGAIVDDRENGPAQWVTYMVSHMSRWFKGGFGTDLKDVNVEYRNSMIKTAALAVAAVEQYDRFLVTPSARTTTRNE